MSRAENLDRFLGRKDVLTRSLHVAYATEEFPYAGILADAGLTYAALTRWWFWLTQILMTAQVLNNT